MENPFRTNSFGRAALRRRRAPSGARPEPFKMLAALILLIAALFGGCSSSGGADLKDGYYTAEATSFDSLGWKHYLTTYVNQDRIVTVEYNSKNASGFIRSWDMDSMRRMNAETGTYPSKYARAYAVALVNRQNPAQVEAVPGAARYLESFRLLGEAAIDRARRGDKSVAFVDLPEAAQEATRRQEAYLPASASEKSFPAGLPSGDQPTRPEPR